MRFVLPCLMVLLMSASVHAEDTVIRWMLTGVPPKFMTEGPFRGQGYGEQQIALLSRRLPQFGHKMELVTPARLWHEMQAGPGVCSVDIAELPERGKWAVFSRRSTSVPGYRMLVMKERVPEFAEFRGDDGLVDLGRLGASERFTGLYVAGRYYMPEISAFIDNPSRKMRLEAMSASTKIFEMVAGRRGDFSFATVSEMNYFNALNAAAAPGAKLWPPLAMIGIKGAVALVHGHIACSRDPLGLRAMQAIDHLLDDDHVWADYLAPEQHWMEDVPLAGR